MRYILEFVGDRGEGLIEPREQEVPIMLPNVGDTIESLDEGSFKVVQRRFWYGRTFEKCQVVLELVE